MVCVCESEWQAGRKMKRSGVRRGAPAAPLLSGTGSVRPSPGRKEKRETLCGQSPSCRLLEEQVRLAASNKAGLMSAENVQEKKKINKSSVRGEWMVEE